MIYFIRAGLSGPVKIGKADDPISRLAALQTAHYETLAVIREMPGGFAEEAWLRRRFSDGWIRGEWHHYCADMLTVVVPESLSPWDTVVPAISRDGPSPSTLIDRMGGTGAVAHLLGCSLSRVSNWRRNGIPTDVFGAIIRASSGRITYTDLETQRIDSPPAKSQQAAA